MLVAIVALAAKSGWWEQLTIPGSWAQSDHQILWAADVAQREGGDPFETAVLDAIGRRTGREHTPFSASQPAAAAVVGLTSSDDYGASYQRWLAVNVVLLVGCLAMCAALARGLAPRRLGWLAAAAVALAIFGFFEATALSLWFNSLNVATTSALLVAAMAWRRVPFAAGFALGLAVVLKTSPALIVALAAAAGAWRVVVGAAVGWGLVTAGALALLGIDVHLAWVQSALPRLGYAVVDEGAFNNALHTWNLSLNGLASRALLAEGRAAAALWSVRGVAILVVGASAVAVQRVARRGQISGTWLIALGVVTSLVVSSVTWPHHLIFASVAWLWWTLRATSPTARLLGGLALVALVPPMGAWGAEELDARVRTFGLVALWAAVLVSPGEQRIARSAGSDTASAEAPHPLS